MPKRSVYFSDSLDEEMKRHPELPIASICQDAVRDAIRSTEKGRREQQESPIVQARRLISQVDRLLTTATKT